VQPTAAPLDSDRVVEPPPLAAPPFGELAALREPIPCAEPAANTNSAACHDAVAPPALLAIESRPGFNLLDWVLRAPSWLISGVVHLSLMLLLALYSTEADHRRQELGLIATEFQAAAPPGPAIEAPPVDLLSSRLDDAAKKSDTLAKGSADKLLVPAGAMLGPSIDWQAAGPGVNPVMPGGMLGGDSLLTGNSLETRLDGDARKRLLLEGGGTPESEAAVERALVWLARHQNSDGSWHFNLKKCVKCRGRCLDGGGVDSRIAATGMALLPFLGKGYTHKSGEHRATIHAGLYFLIRSMHADQHARGSLIDSGGRMYGQGLASIALCEAYGMTRDKMLKGPAQLAVNYIVAAQDPKGGGWRYGFQDRGDTSVVGWQLMALKSAQMAYLEVPTETIRKLEYFLDHVQSDGGAQYGYTDSGAGQATSAIGLLCRQYIGGQGKQEAIARGARYLSEWGPALAESGTRINDLYYNYYATQVLHHVGGEQWIAWNLPMRNYLVGAQQTDEKRHDFGSWHFSGNDMGLGQGGRLYCTAMSAMILEVYYRHMPLYRQKPGRGFFQ
jgi:hypothetical protein